MVWAMGVDPSWADYFPADNLFAGNDLSAASAVYDAYFAAGANHNAVPGTCRTWWDAGTDNLMIDRTTKTGPLDATMAGTTPALRPFTDAMRAKVAAKAERPRR